MLETSLRCGTYVRLCMQEQALQAGGGMPEPGAAAAAQVGIHIIMTYDC